MSEWTPIKSVMLERDRIRDKAIEYQREIERLETLADELEQQNADLASQVKDETDERWRLDDKLSEAKTVIGVLCEQLLAAYPPDNVPYQKAQAFLARLEGKEQPPVCTGYCCRAGDMIVADLSCPVHGIRGTESAI